jgi:hypothetical protein
MSHIETTCKPYEDESPRNFQVIVLRFHVEGRSRDGGWGRDVDDGDGERTERDYMRVI